MSITSSETESTQKRTWIDAHSHLQDQRLTPYLPDIMDRARDGGLELLHVNATCEADWPSVAGLADDYPDLIRCSFGIHPWYIYTASGKWLEHLRTLLADRCCGIGEIGLDAQMNDGLGEEREAIFRTQLDLSYELGLPASIHCRDAWPRMLELLLDAPLHPAGLLIHAYSGPPDALEDLVKKNIYISFGGTITRPKNQKAISNAAAIHPEHYVLESDAPDLPPVLPEALPPYLVNEAGKTLSEPAYVPYIGLYVAKARGISIGDVAAQSTANAKRLFSKLLEHD